MQLVQPSFEIIEQETGLNGIYKHIELAGRTCYKSLDKITENSAQEFVDRMIKSGHGAMLEHGTVYLKVLLNNDLVIENAYGENNTVSVYNRYLYNKYSKVNCRDGLEDIFITDTVEPGYAYITTNLRVLVENNWLDDLEYLCEPTEYHERRITVKFVSDIHFYKDTTRHRVFSWAIESTRFCNYIKEKFGSTVSFLTPIWLKSEEQEEFENDLKTIEDIYFKWINKGWQAQQAAYFLIQGTKAEIIMTGFASDYEHFFNLRSDVAQTGKAHPTVVELVEPLRQEFIKRNLIK
jgi:thymidylate synthase (FAD)